MHLKSRTKVITNLKWCNRSESGQFEIDSKQFIIFAHGTNNRLTIGLEMKSDGYLSARFDAFITDITDKNVYYLKNSDLINFHECVQTRQNLFTINETQTQKYRGTNAEPVIGRRYQRRRYGRVPQILIFWEFRQIRRIKRGIAVRRRQI